MFQQVVIAGYLGADPESRQLPSGAQVANFRVAVGEKWKDKQTGEQRERTEWFSVQAFERLAENVVEYLRKGSPVLVSGTLHTRKWQDKEGNDRYSTELRAGTVKFLPNGERRTETQQAEPPVSRPQRTNRVNTPEPYEDQRRQTASDDFDDDIPF